MRRYLVVCEKTEDEKNYRNLFRLLFRRFVRSKRKGKPLGTKAEAISFISSESNVPQRLYDKISAVQYPKVTSEKCVDP